MQHAVNWFEIPSGDYARAVAFYEKILETTLHQMDMGGSTIAIFPAEEGAVSGHINPPVEQNAPSRVGSIVYLNAEGNLDAILARVEEAGGEVTMPKMDIGGPGFIALFIDSEGNQVGLHAMNP